MTEKAIRYLVGSRMYMQRIKCIKDSKTNDLTLELIMGLNFILREWISVFVASRKRPFIDIVVLDDFLYFAMGFIQILTLVSTPENIIQKLYTIV